MQILDRLKMELSNQRYFSDKKYIWYLYLMKIKRKRVITYKY